MTAPADPRAAEPPVTFCATHPSVESELRCGRCDKLICPRCMVHTPVGVRCQSCARLRRPPMYELAPTHYVRATLAALAVAVPLGIAGAVLLPPRAGAGLFGLVAALLLGSAAGSAMAAAIGWATRHKRGAPLQAIAAVALIVAGVIRLVLRDGLDLLTTDLVGSVLLVIAIIVASGRLS